MFRAAKVSKPLLLTVCRPCLELSRALPATSLAVWRLGGVGGSSTGLPGRGGLLRRGRSRPSCRWITRALSAGLSGSIFSTFLVVWMLGCVLGRLPLDVQGGGGLLGQGRCGASCRWITRALSLSSSGAIFSLAVAGVFFLATLVCLATTVSDSDEELDSLVQKLDLLLGELDSSLEELDSLWALVDLLLVELDLLLAELYSLRGGARLGLLLPGPAGDPLPGHGQPGSFYHGVLGELVLSELVLGELVLGELVLGELVLGKLAHCLPGPPPDAGPGVRAVRLPGGLLHRRTGVQSHHCSWRGRTPGAT